VRRYVAHAIGEGAALTPGVESEMADRVKVGAWPPFTAGEECEGRSFRWLARVGWGPLAPLRFVARFPAGARATAGRLFGRARLFHAAGEDTTRSAAGRAALEAIWAPAPAAPYRRGLAGRERHADRRRLGRAAGGPEVHLRIDGKGAVHSAIALRWGNAGQTAFGYIACGARSGPSAGSVSSSCRAP
jgi:hypothetical protein